MPDLNNPIYIQDFSEHENILFEINDEYVIKKKHYTYRRGGLFRSVLGSIARYVESKDSTGRVDTAGIDGILKYIHENCDKDISNKEIGKSLHQ